MIFAIVIVIQSHAFVHVIDAHNVFALSFFSAGALQCDVNKIWLSLLTKITWIIITSIDMGSAKARTPLTHAHTNTLSHSHAHVCVCTILIQGHSLLGAQHKRSSRNADTFTIFAGLYNIHNKHALMSIA